jgi:hypothetical protein
MRGMIGQMPPGVAARALAEAFRGLHAAHELRDLSGQLLGLVHRDISPDNIMLGFDGHVKVIDFGIALVKNRQAPVTEFGTVKGKPPYMSPEQVKNESMDRRSDVFSLGVVLHEILTGVPLFDGDSIYAIARAVEMLDIRPPSHVLGKELPLGLDAAVMNALDRDPARRTQTAAAFAEDLEQVINNAGDETLEAWAERELEDPRAAHRNWLAGVVSGHDTPRPIGRATNSVTALGDVPPASASVPNVEQPVGRDTPTHLPAMERDDDMLPRKRSVLPILLALLLLGVVGGGIAMLMKQQKSTPVARDAAIAIDAAPIVIDTYFSEHTMHIDAEPDAFVAIDAKTVKMPKDSGQRDAAIIAKSIDAAEPAVVLSGFGKLTALHNAGGAFMTVVIDGKVFGDTPLYGRKLAAGTHKIELIEPDSKAIVVSKTITITDGQSVTIKPP